MPTVIIDGKELTVDKGTNLIEACRALGLEIPHFCYHPGLPVVGQCRMCQVEVEGQPKLAIACATEAADKMVVRVHSERAVKARKAVLEFLLLNHPLDCPICDRGGECPLQEYTMAHGPGKSRFAEQAIDKVHRTKARPIGPYVIFDAERCVLCTRCVRFCKEVPGTAELGVIQRGDRSEIGLFPGKQLDNPLSGNVIDLCPVGALTSRDYRFKSRPWDLVARVDTTCALCSTGCSITMDVRYLKARREVLRVRPRVNKAVNTYWICDQGRFGFHFIHDEARLRAPSVREDGHRRSLSWDEALGRTARGLAEALRAGAGTVGVIASSRLTNEEAYLLQRFARDVLRTPNLDFRLRPEQEPTGDRKLDVLRHADQTPNTRGLRAIGLLPGAGGLGVAEMLAAARDGRLKALLVIEEDPLGDPRWAGPGQEAFARLDQIAVADLFLTRTGEAGHVVFPARSYAEKEGSFTNAEGRVQRVRPAVEPPGQIWSLAEILGGLARHLGTPFPMLGPREAFEALVREVPAFAGMGYEALDPVGLPLSGNGKGSAG
ncbi:MAG: molybdopterin-dependent oxidoreductase [Deltaproteobacteria bacterium]|nr:molybdopterin-dependent oxidoreductase [Deltaproteobacteria bacterium]